MMKARGEKRGTRGRRGSILVMTLVVVTIGALVGTSIVYYSGADRRAADMGVRRVQARAMAWSGVQAVMAELEKQREMLLAGDAPTLTEMWVCPVGEMGNANASEVDTTRWGFRVLPVRTKTAWSEMGKVDVNHAPAEVMEKLPGLNAEIAGAIVSQRKSRAFTSVAELLTVPGVTYAVLYGGGDSGAEGAGGAGEMMNEDASGGAGLHRFVTVYSFDPEVQVGIGPKASESAGKQRININVGWSEELGEAIEERFDKNIADGVKGMMERGEKFEKASSIVKKLRELRVEPKEWVEVLDAFTTNADPYRLGAIDLMTAPAVVLGCVPGISADAAEEIVARREKLDVSRRWTVAWPVLEDIVKGEDFEKAVDYLTSRSLQWRVVVEGGVFPAMEEGGGGAGLGGEGERGPDWELSAGGPITETGSEVTPLRDRVVLEAVIDVSSLRSRVAYLRDVTFLPTARSLAEMNKNNLRDNQTANIEEEGTKGNISESLAAGLDTELNMPGLDFGGGSEDDGMEGLDFGGLESRIDSEAEESRIGKGGAGEGGAGADPLPTGQDRRLGRWTTGSGGSR